jgi:hypothetical protein
MRTSSRLYSHSCTQCTLCCGKVCVLKPLSVLKRVQSTTGPGSPDKGLQQALDQLQGICRTDASGCCAGGGNVACVGAAVVHYGMRHHEAWAACKGAVEGEQHASGSTAFRAFQVLAFKR